MRIIDFVDCQVTIGVEGTCLDLRGDDDNLSVFSLAGCLITFDHLGNIRVEAGDKVKTIPALTFANCAGDVRIQTGSVEDRNTRITFGYIILSTDVCRFFRRRK